MLKNMDYSAARALMQPGDVIAFSGTGLVSNLIKLCTNSSVSHVGVILQSEFDAAQNGFLNMIIESTSLNGFTGVSINRMSDRLKEYDGAVWWLPLSDHLRRELHVKKFYQWCLYQGHKAYDFKQVVGLGLTKFFHLGKLEKDYSKLFCSELVAGGLAAGKALKNINSSMISPIDLCQLTLYQLDYYQLKGETQPIRGFNAVKPEYLET